MTGHKDRDILITGCSTGIGHACAQGLKNRGYRVFASARRQEDVERLANEGLEALWLDLDDPVSIQQAMVRVLSSTGGRLYPLFNNGAYGQAGAVEDLSREVLRAQLETNLLGWHDLTCRVVPVMRKQGYGRWQL
jgi:NAD(P)-dependent dehydrogenase (short-subunit alcohol dehydrogenase family)